MTRPDVWDDSEFQMDICCITTCCVEEPNFKYGIGYFLCEEVPKKISRIGNGRLFYGKELSVAQTLYTYDDSSISMYTNSNTCMTITKKQIRVVSYDANALYTREYSFVVRVNNGFLLHEKI